MSQGPWSRGTLKETKQQTTEIKSGFKDILFESALFHRITEIGDENDLRGQLAFWSQCRWFPVDQAASVLWGLMSYAWQGWGGGGVVGRWGGKGVISHFLPPGFSPLSVLSTWKFSQPKPKFSFPPI